LPVLPGAGGVRFAPLTALLIEQFGCATPAQA